MYSRRDFGKGRPIPAEVEMEYKIPAGSNSVQEVAKCMQYMKDALA